ncbi:MAG: HAMP domain-containing histidine kinase [Solirubrobacterales bacterium]|nr:HAMP domain-containing histidine kinase [Solirubrobacterales bacterium]
MRPRWPQRLRPDRWPVRWRIAGICAALTAGILIAFALVLGNLVGHRIKTDYNDELQNAVSSLGAETQVLRSATTGQIIPETPRLTDVAMADDAVVRVVDQSGHPISGATTNPRISLGPPRGEITKIGEYYVASEPVAQSGGLPIYVQYGRPYTGMDATVARLWLFLGAGVLVGTMLAMIAGLTVANRAMRPVSSLTALAKDIAATRDPSRRMPVQATDDEVGELAETMDEMLRSLDDARTEREAAFERQRRFVADASHELRTPLTSVMANLELLQTSIEQADDQTAVDSALRSTQRMSRLVGDLLLLARADAGRRAARHPLDLSEAVEGAIHEVEPVAGDHKIRSEVAPGLRVEGNPDELHRLALNLIDNAVRHTPTGSTVTVRVASDGDRALLEVSDDGPGIPAEMGSQVFERFVRGQGPADTTGGGGSGLGLAIVRSVAESHGGSVEAGASTLGGATFSVRLPLLGDTSGPAPAVGNRDEDAVEPTVGNPENI